MPFAVNYFAHNWISQSSFFFKKKISLYFGLPKLDNSFELLSQLIMDCVPSYNYMPNLAISLLAPFFPFFSVSLLTFLLLLFFHNVSLFCYLNLQTDISKSCWDGWRLRCEGENLLRKYLGTSSLWVVFL